MKNVLLICLFFAVNIHAQTVDSLTASLTQGITDEAQKVTRIYDWVTKNIRYEERFRQNRVEGDTTLWQEPYTVIVRKKAVCIGYAKLFQAMCRSTKIEAELIIGLAKNMNGKLEREEHVWNAAKINGQWVLLDPTWDEGKSLTFKQFFMSPPSVFIETHYPNDPMWQLLTDAKTFACFLNAKDCRSNQPTVFNFQDTIAAWQSLDSFNQHKTSAERGLKYNPNSLDAMRNLANAHSHEAFETFKIFANWRNQVSKRLNATAEKEDVMKWLDTIEDNLQQARFFYDRIILTFARKNEYTDAQYNRDLMLENLLKLENERRFVVKFFTKK